MATLITALMEQRADLDARIAAAKEAELSSAVQHAANVFGEAGVPLDEAATALLALHNKTAHPQRAKVAPKYRHRVSGATWTGRGKRPKWFVEAEQSEIEHIGGSLA